MENAKKYKALRIFIASTDKIGNKLLYEHIVFEARKFGLAGATVTQGVLGYGSSSVMHSYKFWEVSDKLPTRIEIIDEEEKITAFYEYMKPTLEDMKYGCLVVTANIDVLMHKPGSKHPH